MNQFTSTTACARARVGPKHAQALRITIRVLAAACVSTLLATTVAAQRIEVPTPVQPVQSTTPYATTPAPYVAPASPYAVAPATPTYVAPTAPLGAPPAYSPSAVGPPPAFDPYASGSTLGSTPAVAAPAPYTYTPPPVAPYPAPVAPAAPLAPQPAPFPYQAQPYDITTSGEGYWAKTQRVLQEISFEYSYIYGKASSPFEMSINRAEISSTFAFPIFGNIDSPLLVTPGFATDWLGGPATGPPNPGPPVTAGGPDMPPRLYDAYLDFAWYPHCYDWLGGELGFRTGVWSDFQNVDSDSVRFLGRGLASVALSPTLDVRFGAVYLDRVDVKILPAGGVYWRPTPDWDLYLVFPNPKVRKFITAVGNTKWYAYAAGEYGGGSWTVQRETTNDRVDYNDIRVLGGLEWETQTLIRGHIEAGYVFDRNLVFDSGDPGRFDLSDTWMVRAGINF